MDRKNPLRSGVRILIPSVEGIKSRQPQKYRSAAKSLMSDLKRLEFLFPAGLVKLTSIAGIGDKNAAGLEYRMAARFERS
ncbi:hypothetical protein ACTMU2_18315 [Cupriavidus basilensis]